MKEVTEAKQACPGSCQRETTDMFTANRTSGIAGVLQAGLGTSTDNISGVFRAPQCVSEASALDHRWCLVGNMGVM